MNILVTDGETRPALAIVRSLGSKGHRLFVGAKSQPVLAQVSRYCHRRFTYPDPVIDGARFVEAIIEILQTQSIEVVLPVTEITTALIVQQKGKIEQYSRVPFPSARIFNCAADKTKVLALAEKLSIPIPISVVLDNVDVSHPWPEGLRYPVVIKPHRSRIYVNGQWKAASVTYANNQQELNAALRAKDKWEYPLLLQERVVGPGVGVFLCYQQGRCVAHFSHRRLREKPPSGGVSVLCESVEAPPEALRYAQVLLDELKWEGVAMVEFKFDQAAKTYKLMEINGRFWGSLQLAIDAGVDFPSLLIQALENKPMRPIETYHIGVKSRWLMGDLDSLLMRLLKSETELHLPPGYPGKIDSILRFLSSWGQDIQNEVFRISDLKPGLHEIKRWLLSRA
ncbi:MAG: ATP-grasp domain-containing protein [Nitrospira sp.]|nr:ATP-grasp domain-containing protein [Nitrospira sp.]